MRPSSFGIPNLLPFYLSLKDSVCISSGKPARHLSPLLTGVVSPAQAETKGSRLRPLAPRLGVAQAVQATRLFVHPTLPEASLTSTTATSQL